ncbi:cadherin-23-like [Limulus polyphemus]|uniref:Cadherin-23-like n=1 Tax=Limulus polyphemus TaxID=6850 RepID=A0ABM1S6P5_LIMPO|nr:cadherin-23-like [Limulus polyphemus]
MQHLILSTTSWFVLLSTCCVVIGGSNNPPRFAIGGISEIVVRVQEGPESQGKLLYRLNGEDPDEDKLTYGVMGPVGKDLLRFESVGKTDANVYLRHELDREVKDSYSFVLTLTDGKLREGYYITQTMLIIVEDVNDNEPVFKPFRSTISVREDAVTGVLETVEAVDQDAGPFGQVIYKLQNEEEDVIKTFSVQTQNGKGVINLIGPLDFEKKSLYQLRVLATDRANSNRKNTATAAILVKVEDVEDQPPVFSLVPPVTRIPEDLPLGSHVLTVKAIDGDREIDNVIKYRIIKGGRALFEIDSFSGVVTVKGKLDREGTENNNGAYILEIEAQEDTPVVYPVPSVKTEVTVILTDVNDETPTFRSKKYIAEVNENAQVNVPVNFIGDSLPEVFDHDQGTNGTFRMYLEEDNDVFEVTPSEGVNEASFLIRVKHSIPLDYERVKVMNFKIIARETAVISPKSSTADVTVYIRDTNDNFPQFSDTMYQVTIPEDVREGTTVAVVKATDQDSEAFGTDGIRYTDLRGQVADKLTLDSISGVITVKTSQHGFDRETTSQYYVTVEARDNEGLGNRNTVQLQITLEDVNDNSPEFLFPQYEARLHENEASFLTPLVVQAEDKDLKNTRNSEIRYQIVGGDRQGNFTIDAVTGEIRPRAPLDFEMISQEKGDVRTFRLKARAYDLGEPSLSNDVSVEIYVRDTNDVVPVFHSSFYNKAIPEDTPGGTSVLQVQAFDGDHSPANSRVVYRIQTGAQDKFVIDANTGIISVAVGANLDPDMTNPRTTIYLLEVVALDGGIGDDQKHAVTRTNISIIDVNNKSPTFTDLVMTLVPEDAPVGHLVARVKAVDLDEKPILRYSFDYFHSEAKNENGAVVLENEFDIQGVFDINNADGTITVVKALDREKIETMKLVLKVEDLAATTDGQTATATLTVQIDDINDNRPVFKKLNYKHVVAENSKAGSPVLTVIATDADKNRTISYSLEGRPQVLSLLSIDSKTGEITVDGKIDREHFSWLNLTIRAIDGGKPPLSSTADLYLQVLDENDNNPVFVDRMSDFTVPEDTPVGHEVATIKATDADTGDYGKLTYTWDSAGAEGKFRIDRETGQIIVSEKLDREDKDIYSLIVQAWDNYEYGFSTGESRKAFIKISIRVTDVNDETPTFVKQLLCASVTEFHELRKTVFMVSAIDKDDPFTENSRVTFSIVNGNQAGLFEIQTLEDNSAKILSQKPLRNRFGNYTLEIRAQDRGRPSLNSTETFHVCVTDVNDHNPIFFTPPSNYTIRIPENATVGSTVLHVSASDDDIGDNGQVRYRLKELSNGHWRTFHIDKITGILTLQNMLDREKQRNYELRVEAYDLGQPTSLSSDLDVTVYVTDVNDYAPEFTEDVYRVAFIENHPPNKEKFKLIPTIDKDDHESLTKAIPCYFIVGGNEKNRFRLDIFTHELYAIETLDREEKSEYSLIIQAADDCFHIPPSIERFDPWDNTLLQVDVTVKDVNDNAPQFVKSVFTGGITTEADFGSIFMTVKATDSDIGVNSIVHYYIVGSIRRTLSEALESIRGPPFLLDNKTGEISLNFDPQKKMKGYFDFEILVNDTDGLFDTARVFIYLLREDQRVRFVLRLTPTELRQKLEEFREELNRQPPLDQRFLTQINILLKVLKISISPQFFRSDLYLHFINRKDNSIMDVDTVLSLIDKNNDYLDELFKEFNVLYSEAAKSTSLLDGADDQMKVWLIGLAVFLVIMLVLVLSLCVTQRSRYERQLKAATATAFGTQQSATTSTDIPNTTHICFLYNLSVTAKYWGTFYL